MSCSRLSFSVSVNVSSAAITCLDSQCATVSVLNLKARFLFFSDFFFFPFFLFQYTLDDWISSFFNNDDQDQQTDDWFSHFFADLDSSSSSSSASTSDSDNQNTNTDNDWHISYSWSWNSDDNDNSNNDNNSNNNEVDDNSNTLILDQNNDPWQGEQAQPQSQHTTYFYYRFPQKHQKMYDNNRFEYVDDNNNNDYNNHRELNEGDAEFYKVYIRKPYAIALVALILVFLIFNII